MRLSILCAGMFAVLSLAAPAWAETGDGAEGQSACDYSVLPDAALTKKSSELSTTESLSVDGALLQENGLPALSEKAAYRAYKSACLKSSLFANGRNTALSDNTLISGLRQDLAAMLPNPIPSGSVALKEAVAQYLNVAYAFNEQHKSVYLSKVLQDVTAAFSKGNRNDIFGVLDTYTAVTSMDYTSLAGKLPEEAPKSACMSGTSEEAKDRAIKMIAGSGDKAAITAIQMYKDVSLRGRGGALDNLKRVVTPQFIAALFNNEQIGGGRDLMIGFAGECATALTAWIDGMTQEAGRSADVDKLLLQLFSSVIENGDTDPSGVTGVQRYFTYAQLKAIVSRVSDIELYKKMYAQLMLFYDGIRLPKNAVYIPPPNLELPLEPSPS